MIDFGETQNSIYKSQLGAFNSKQQIQKPNGYKYSQNQIDHKLDQKIQKNNFFRQQENAYDRLKKLKEGKYDELPENKDKEYNQQQIFQKLGIKQQKDVVNVNKIIGDNLGIDEDFIHSAKIEGVRGQVSDQIIDDVEGEIERIRQRRQNLMGKKNYYKVDDQPYQYLHDQQHFSQEEQPQDVDDIIKFKWKEQEPTLEEIENQIKQNSNRLKNLEETGQISYNMTKSKNQNYMFLDENNNKAMVNNLIRDNHDINYDDMTNIHKDILQIAGYDKQQLLEEQQQQFKQYNPKHQYQSQNYLQETRQQKKDRIVREEMELIEQKINQEAYDNYLNKTKPKKLIKPEKTKVVSVKQQNQQEKLESYQLDKQLQDIVNIKQEHGQKPKFDRFLKKENYQKKHEYKNKKQNQQLDLVDIPRPQNAEEKQQRDIEQGMEILENDQHTNDRKLQLYLEKLYSRILEDFNVYQKKKVSRNEEFILRYIFMQMDTNQIGFVQKEEIFSRIQNDQEIIQYFQIVLQTLYKDLGNFQCERTGLFNFQDFQKFIKSQGQLSKNQQEQEKENQKTSHKQQFDSDYEDENQQLDYTEGNCVLKDEFVDFMRIVYNNVDKYNDFIVERTKLVQEMKRDTNMQKILNKPAVKIPVTNKKVTVNNILDHIVSEYENADHQQKMNLEYITWNQYFDYFKTFNSDNLKSFNKTQLKLHTTQKSLQKTVKFQDQEVQQQNDNSYKVDDCETSYLNSPQKNNQTLNESSNINEIEIYDINEEDLEILQDMFDMMPHIQTDYVNIQDYVLSCKNDFQVNKIKDNLCRLESEETQLQQESVQEALDRIIYEAEEHCTWDEIYQFLSRRGRPLSYISYSNNKNNAINDNKAKNNILGQEFQGDSEDYKSQPYQILRFKSSGEFNFENVKNDPEFRDEFVSELFQGICSICKVKQEYVDILKIQQYNEDEFQVLIKIQMQNQIRLLNEKEQLKFQQFFPIFKLKFIKYNKYNNFDDLQGIEMRDGKWQDCKKSKFTEDEEFYQIKKFSYEPFDIEQIRTMKYQLKDTLQQQKPSNDNQKSKSYTANISQKKQQDQNILTVPEPFDFEKRKKELNMTIKQKKTEEMIQQIKKKEDDMLNYKFKANKVPIETKIPMYDNIIQKQKEKREKTRQEYKQNQKNNSQPFSFYERDQAKKQQKIATINSKVQKELQLQKKQTKIKAKEIPITSKQEMLPQLERQRQKRSELNKQKRKKEMEQERENILKKKCPRMLEQEVEYKKKMEERLNAKTQEEIDHCTGKPKINEFDFGKKEKSVSEIKEERKSKGQSFIQAKPKQVKIHYLEEDNKKDKQVLKGDSKDRRLSTDKFKSGQKKEQFDFNNQQTCEEKLKDLEQQFEWSRKGELYKQIGKKTMSADDIQLLNKLRKKKEDDEKAKKQVKIDEKKQKEKEEIKKINDERKKQEQEKMKEIKAKREAKLNSQPMNMEKKQHGSNLLDKYRNQQPNTSENGDVIDKQSTQKSIQEEEDEQDQKKEDDDDEENKKKQQEEEELKKKQKEKEEEEKRKKQEEEEEKERERQLQLARERAAKEEEEERLRELKEEEERMKMEEEELQRQEEEKQEEEKRKQQEKEEQERKVKEQEELEKKRQKEAEEKKRLQEQKEAEEKKKRQEEQEKQQKEEEEEKLKKQKEEEEKNKQKQIDLEKQKQEREEKLKKAKEDLDKLNSNNSQQQTQKEQRKEHTQIKDISEYLITVNQSKQYNKSKEQFTDDVFKPHQDSLSKNNLNQFESAQKVQKWLRAKQCIGDKVQVFLDKIEAKDILQGALGDCYFLSSLSVIAEREQGNLIKRLFQTQFTNDQSQYSVFLCYDGEWTQVILDDFFPCNQDGQMVFSRSNGQEMWVQLLEKAYAKIYSSYQKIEAGLTTEAVRDLTGAPGKILKNDVNKWQESWEFVIKNIQKQYIMTAGSQSDDRGREIQQESGIVSGHAYAILDAREIKNNNGELENIVKMRNPWGEHEWKGDWSDQSSKWTEETKKLVNLTDIDDGVFWISIHDFCKEYSDVSCNMLHTDYYYSSYRQSIKDNNTVYYADIFVDQNCHCIFSINQKDKRNYKFEKQEDQYKYSMGRVFMAKLQEKNDQLKYIECSHGCERNLNLECDLEKNQTYRLYVTMEWLQNFYNEIVLSSYSNNKKLNLQDFTFKQLDYSDFSQQLDSLLQQIPPSSQTQIETIEDQITQYTMDKGGYMFTVIKNQTENKTLEQNIELISSDNLELVYKNYDKNEKKFKVEVPPQKTEIIKYQIMAKGQGAYSFQTGGGYRVTQSFSDDQLIQNAKNDPNAKQEREGLNVVCYTHLYNGGMVMFWENLNNDKTYYESVQLNLKGLEGIGFDGSKEQNIVVKPKDTYLLKCKAIGGQMGCGPASKGIRLEAAQNQQQAEQNNDNNDDDDDDEYGDDDFEDEEE